MGIGRAITTVTSHRALRSEHRICNLLAASPIQAFSRTTWTPIRGRSICGWVGIRIPIRTTVLVVGRISRPGGEALILSMSLA